MTIEILQSERLVNIFEVNKLPNYSYRHHHTLHCYQYTQNYMMKKIVELLQSSDKLDSWIHYSLWNSHLSLCLDLMSRSIYIHITNLIMINNISGVHYVVYTVCTVFTVIKQMQYLTTYNQWCGNSQSCRTLSDKSGERLVN